MTKMDISNEIMDEEIITPIGTLEWNMGTIYNLPAYLESMRPTVEGDKEHSTRYIGQCPIPMLKVGASHDDVKRVSIEAMMVTITHVLTIMEKDGIEGLVFLCFVTHQLRWDIKVVCNAYVPQLKQV